MLMLCSSPAVRRGKKLITDTKLTIATIKSTPSTKVSHETNFNQRGATLQKTAPTPTTWAEFVSTINIETPYTQLFRQITQANTFTWSTGYGGTYATTFIRLSEMNELNELNELYEINKMS